MTKLSEDQSMSDLARMCLVETPEEARERRAQEDQEDAEACAMLQSALLSLKTFLSSIEPWKCAQMFSFGSVWTFWLQPPTSDAVLYWAAGTIGNEFEETDTASNTELDLGWSDATQAANCIDKWLADPNRLVVTFEQSVLVSAAASSSSSINP